MIKGYKAFDKDLKCRNFQYEIGHTYEMDEEVKKMNNLINALKRFDSLETVIAELEVCELSESSELYELIEYLNDEADYANE